MVDRRGVIKYARIVAAMLAFAAAGVLDEHRDRGVVGHWGVRGLLLLLPRRRGRRGLRLLPADDDHDHNGERTAGFTAPANQSSDEGETKSFALGSFSDANNNGPWEVRVTWGDGSSAETFMDATAGALPNRSHTYAEDGLYTVTVRVEDAAGASDVGTFQVTVANLPPSCGPIVAPLAPVKVNTLVTATAPFTDPGIEDTHTASGVGRRHDLGRHGHGGQRLRTATGSHTYTVPGVYTVTLTVTDDDGGSDQSVFQYVVVYDPTAGFVTGGGWINSPGRGLRRRPDPHRQGELRLRLQATRTGTTSRPATPSSSSRWPTSTSRARATSGWSSPGPRPGSAASARSTGSAATASS